MRSSTPGGLAAALLATLPALALAGPAPSLPAELDILALLRRDPTELADLVLADTRPGTRTRLTHTYAVAADRRGLEQRLRAAAKGTQDPGARAHLGRALATLERQPRLALAYLDTRGLDPDALAAALRRNGGRVLFQEKEGFFRPVRRSLVSIPPARWEALKLELDDARRASELLPRVGLVVRYKTGVVSMDTMRIIAPGEVHAHTLDLELPAAAALDLMTDLAGDPPDALVYRFFHDGWSYRHFDGDPEHGFVGKIGFQVFLPGAPDAAYTSFDARVWRY